MWLLVNHTKPAKYFVLKLISFNCEQLQKNTVNGAISIAITITYRVTYSITSTERTHINTRSSTLKLNQPLRKSNYSQRNISYLAPVKWNSLPENLKRLENINLFKHEVKDHFLETLNREEKNIYKY